jgi:hypothetical protein
MVTVWLAQDEIDGEVGRLVLGWLEHEGNWFLKLTHTEFLTCKTYLGRIRNACIVE